MRKIATLAQWKNLYELATQVVEKKPWNLYDENQILEFQNEASGETTYIQTLGKQNEVKGLVVYEGLPGFNDFLLNQFAEEEGLSSAYILANQTCVALFLGDREAVDKEDMKVIKDLGYTYRGKGNWLYFQSYQRGFLPYQLDQDEVRILTDRLETFLEAWPFIQTHPQAGKFGTGFLYRYTFDYRKDVEKGELAPWPQLQFVPYETRVTLTDQTLENLHRRGQTDTTLEVDMEYFPIVLEADKKKKDRPRWVRMLMVVEEETGTIMANNFLQEEEGVGDAAVDFLADYILENGRPACLIVGNALMEYYLASFCRSLDIDCVQGPLTGIDDALATFNQTMMK